MDETNGTRRRHFDRVGDAITVNVPAARDGENEEMPAEMSNLLIVPVAQLDPVTVRALAYAASLGQPVLAVHLSPTEEESARFGRSWATWGDLAVRHWWQRPLHDNTAIRLRHALASLSEVVVTSVPLHV